MENTRENILRSLDSALDNLLLRVKEFGRKPTKENQELADKAEKEFKKKLGIQGW